MLRELQEPRDRVVADEARERERAALLARPVNGMYRSPSARK